MATADNLRAERIEAAENLLMQLRMAHGPNACAGGCLVGAAIAEIEADLAALRG